MKKSKDGVASEHVYKGIKISGLDNKDKIHKALTGLIPSTITNNDVVFVAIGTDRSTGDSFGPIIGKYLKDSGYQNVYGCVDDPVHAMNLEETIESLPKNKIVIAIDACLGQVSSVGTTQLVKGSIKPGAGVKKELPSIGDYSLMGVVNVGGFMEYFVLQNTRLSLVMKMAKDVATAIEKRFPLCQTDSKCRKKFLSRAREENIVYRLKKSGLDVTLVRKWGEHYILHYYKCPDPDCNYTAEYISSYHCESVHGLTKTEMIEEYSEPIKITYDFAKYMKNRRFNSRLKFQEKKESNIDMMMDLYIKEHKQIRKDEWYGGEED